MRFNVLPIAKMVASGIVGIGTGKIVGRIIKDHITPETLIEKVSVTAATWVISGIVTTAAKEYTNDMIDEAVEQVRQVSEKVKLDAKLARINKDRTSFEDEGLDERDFQRNSTTAKWEPKPVVPQLVDLKKFLDNSGLRNLHVEIGDDGTYHVDKTDE